MFSGIVVGVGTVRRIDAMSVGAARRIVVEVPGSFMEGVKVGDSIAVDGVCLTVADADRSSFTVDVVGSTMARTTIGGYGPGRRVNLEPALALGDRVGGHLIQGHIDGTGRVESVETGSDQVVLDVSLPAEAAEVTVARGSIAINGVSLTVSDGSTAGHARVALIPYTWEHTNLSELKAGSEVNIEGDMLGRFVVHYLKLRDGV